MTETVELRFEAKDATEAEIRETFASLNIPDNAYTIRSDRTTKQSFLTGAAHRFDPGPVVIAIATEVVAAALYDLIKHVLNQRRLVKEGSAHAPEKEQEQTPPKAP